MPPHSAYPRSRIAEAATGSLFEDLKEISSRRGIAAFLRECYGQALKITLATMIMALGVCSIARVGRVGRAS